MPSQSLMKLYCDNKAAISIVHNLFHYDKPKYVEIDHHFIKEKIEEELICITYIPTKQQIVGILTKGLPRQNFEDFTFKLGLLDFFFPQLEGECSECYLGLSLLCFSFTNVPFYKFKIVGN